jgi:hypothetical protein
MQAIKEVLDGVEGKAPQAQEHSGEVEHQHYLGAADELRRRIARIRAARGAESGAEESE